MTDRWHCSQSMQQNMTTADIKFDVMKTTQPIEPWRLLTFKLLDLEVNIRN